jgi:hypothetical protein
VITIPAAYIAATAVAAGILYYAAPIAADVGKRLGNWMMSDGGSGDSYNPNITPGGTCPNGPDDEDPIIFRGKKVNKRLADELGIDRRRLGKSMEKIKESAGHGGRDNVNITKSGNVFSQRSGEYIGNIFDEFSF